MSVRDHSLVSKLANFALQDYLHNRMVNNLSGRQHQTKLDGSVSSRLPINASIIQGSTLGPVAYVLTASDLHPTTCSANTLTTLASWLLHPIRPIPQEIQHITNWATVNNLQDAQLSQRDRAAGCDHV